MTELISLLGLEGGLLHIRGHWLKNSWATRFVSNYLVKQTDTVHLHFSTTCIVFLKKSILPIHAERLPFQCAISGTRCGLLDQKRLVGFKSGNEDGCGDICVHGICVVFECLDFVPNGKA